MHPEKNFALFDNCLLASLPDEDHRQVLKRCDSVELTLGERRVGVTKAATALQQRHLIHYSRGDMRVVDRAGLQAAACACYGESEALYERFMG
ncbi:hypothetical protein [Thiocapsa sp.]|uniref:hypothetical protein n=1 Tax=Thiocapsa sp. TaxID=2024551 RepID=UPI00359327F4